jgi:hypothetical protein
MRRHCQNGKKHNYFNAFSGSCNEFKGLNLPDCKLIGRIFQDSSYFSRIAQANSPARPRKTSTPRMQ